MKLYVTPFPFWLERVCSDGGAATLRGRRVMVQLLCLLAH